MMPRNDGRVGVYPGSFNPPTIAHLAISDAALQQCQLDTVVWSISTTALAKETVQHPRLADRLEVLNQVSADHDWLEIQVTDLQLLSEISIGFDALIMGADKWLQIQDVRWYGTSGARAEAMAGLPQIAVAPRPPIDVPAEHLLQLDESHAAVSSTAARNGALDQMLPHARTFAERTGAWIDLHRYEAANLSTDRDDPREGP